MTRTDVHRPSALVTEDYEFVGCGYYGSADEPGYSPLANEAAHLLDEGWRMGGEGGGNCDHCGARIKYWAILKHLPSHTLIRVGETCLDNRFERSTAAFHTLRKQAQLDREKQRTKRARLRFFAEYPDAEEAYEWCRWAIAAGNKEDGAGYGWEGTRHKFVASLNRYGNVSQRFLKMIMRDIARTERWIEERAAKTATEPEATPVIEGRIEITGTILARKHVEGDFGSTTKLLIRDDRGFKVWGTLPAILDGDWNDEGEWVSGAGKGDRVTLTATVEKSRDDETFGFYKRPSKASIIEHGQEEE